MVDRIRVGHPREGGRPGHFWRSVTLICGALEEHLLTYFISVCNQATQVDSAFYPPWDDKTSTSQRVVMLCGWGVKEGMAYLRVKLCVAIYLSTLEHALVFKGTLQMTRFSFTILWWSRYSSWSDVCLCLEYWIHLDTIQSMSSEVKVTHQSSRSQEETLLNWSFRPRAWDFQVRCQCKLATTGPQGALSYTRQAWARTAKSQVPKTAGGLPSDACLWHRSGMYKLIWLIITLHC